MMLANRSIPRSTVIPELAYQDVGEAIAWLCDAFGLTLRLRIANHRAQLNVREGLRGGNSRAENARGALMRALSLEIGPGSAGGGSHGGPGPEPARAPGADKEACPPARGAGRPGGPLAFGSRRTDHRPSRET